MVEFSFSLNEVSTYKTVLFICSIGMVITTCEYIYTWRYFRADGIYSWAIYSAFVPLAKKPTIKIVLDLLFSVQGIVSLFIFRLLTILALNISPFQTTAFKIALTGLILSILIMSWRQSYGDHGSDQMNLVVLGSTWLCTVPIESDLLLKAGIWFIAMQSILSYVTSGIAKLISPIWRSGDATLRILSTNCYGVDWAVQVLNINPKINFLLCWATMIFESWFFLALILPFPYTIAFIIGGLLFHISCGVIMGLNNFLWAFTSTYPAIIYAWHFLH